MVYILYVCDSQKHLNKVMRSNYDVDDIFMTVRLYNKFIKLHPERSKREDTKEYFLLEENEKVNKYLVMRCSEHCRNAVREVQ